MAWARRWALGWRASWAVVAVLGVGTAALLPACHDKATIPGTSIPDSEENREVLRVLERYRTAFVRRDAAGILAMAHATYYDTAGSDDPSDDVVYEDLGPLLRTRFEGIESVRFTMDYLDVFIDRDRAAVKVWIDASFRLRPFLDAKGGVAVDARHTRVQDYAEFELTRERESWLISRGM